MGSVWLISIWWDMVSENSSLENPCSVWPLLLQPPQAQTVAKPCPLEPAPGGRCLLISAPIFSYCDFQPELFLSVNWGCLWGDPAVNQTCGNHSHFFLNPADWRLPVCLSRVWTSKFGRSKKKRSFVIQLNSVTTLAVKLVTCC
jgi:hypothetical protein